MTELRLRKYYSTGNYFVLPDDTFSSIIHVYPTDIPRGDDRNWKRFGRSCYLQDLGIKFHISASIETGTKTGAVRVYDDPRTHIINFAVFSVKNADPSILYGADWFWEDTGQYTYEEPMAMYNSDHVGLFDVLVDETIHLRQTAPCMQETAPGSTAANLS